MPSKPFFIHLWYFPIIRCVFAWHPPVFSSCSSTFEFASWLHSPCKLSDEISIGAVFEYLEYHSEYWEWVLNLPMLTYYHHNSLSTCIYERWIHVLRMKFHSLLCLLFCFFMHESLREFNCNYSPKFTCIPQVHLWTSETMPGTDETVAAYQTLSSVLSQNGNLFWSKKHLKFTRLLKPDI